MPGVVELIDRAVELPPGPQLAALLAELPWAEIPNARLVEVLQAHNRQLAHAQARLFAGMAEIARATPVAGLPDNAVSRADEDFEWASHEIAAALTWTPTTADRELDFSLVLVRGLPLVFAALEAGLIDRGKAKVFCDHLDPARGELTPAQIRRLCERFVPLASGWTARRLSRRLLAAVQAIDPEFHRRRYRRGLRERGVVLHLNRDGTATLVGEGLAPDEAAAAAARLDRLAVAARRAGHRGRLGQISADLYQGMLDGSFHGLTEGQILDRLLAQPRPEDEDNADTDPADADVTDTATGADPGEAGATGADSAGTNSGQVDSTDADSTGTDVADAASPGAASNDAASAGAGSGSADLTGADLTGAEAGDVGLAEAGSAGSAGTEFAGVGSSGDGLDHAGRAEACPSEAGETEIDPLAAAWEAASTGTGAGEDRWRGERVGVREGIELRVGLATLLGCDQWPAEIPGLGPVDAQLARAAVARQRRGAQWQFAIVDTGGYLLLAGPLRRRPRPGSPPGGAGPPDRVRGGVVELHVTLAELSEFAADPDLAGEWAGVVAEIAQRWADRHRLWRELGKDPQARFARGALARHVQVRDRSCVGPGCDRPARRSQLDHTVDHGRGGLTVAANLGPGCFRHHPDKDRGWTLFQPEPGRFVWISPLGRVYRTRGGPVRPELPEPEPPPQGSDQREDPDTELGSPVTCASCGGKAVTPPHRPRRRRKPRRSRRSSRRARRGCPPRRRRWRRTAARRRVRGRRRPAAR